MMTVAVQQTVWIAELPNILVHFFRHEIFCGDAFLHLSEQKTSDRTMQSVSLNYN